MCVCAFSVENISAETYPCATPVFKTIETVEQGIRFTWDPVPGAELYRVYYYGRNGWTKMVTTARTSFLEMDCQPGKSFVYTIRVVNYDQNAFLSDYNGSGWSAYYYYRPSLGNTACATVNASIDKNNNGYFLVMWKDVGASKYNVEMRYEGETEWKRIAICTGTSYKHVINANTSVGRDVSKPRAYRVYAIDDSGNKASEAAVSPYKLRKSASVYGRGTWLKWLMDAAGYDVDFNWSTRETYDKAVEYGILKSWKDSDVNEGLRRQYVADTMMRAFGYEQHALMTKYDANEDITYDNINHRSKLKNKVGDLYYANDTSNSNLNTISYYGWFLTNYDGNLFPNGHISADDFDKLKDSLAMYKEWHGKKLVSFGDSVMHGSGNKLSESNGLSYDSQSADFDDHRYPRGTGETDGLAELFGEKYGMIHRDYSVGGALMGVLVQDNTDLSNQSPYMFRDNDNNIAFPYKFHVANQVRTAIIESQEADLIFLNGDNDLVYNSRNGDGVYGYGVALEDVLYRGNVWDYDYATGNEYSGGNQNIRMNQGQLKSVMNYDNESSFTSGMNMAINLIRNNAGSNSVKVNGQYKESKMANAPIIMIRAHEARCNYSNSSSYNELFKNQHDFGQRITDKAKQTSNCYGFDAYNWGDYTGQYSWANRLFANDMKGVHNNGRGETFHYLPGLEFTVNKIG